MKAFTDCKEEIEMFDKMRRKEVTQEELIESALYAWLNKTEEVETAVCKLLDGEIKKKDLKRLKLELEKKYKILEDFIKLY